MQIGSITNTAAGIQAQKSGNNLLPVGQANDANVQQNKSFLRELAESFDPKNMSRKDSMNLANALMKAGEGDLSTVFLPPPLLKQNSDGSVKDLTGTPKGDVKMNERFNMFDSLTSRIEYKKSMNEPTELLEKAFSFLEKIQVARNTPSINEHA